MTQTLLHIQRALISVSNKSNISQFAHILTKHNIQLLASGGTAKKLLQSGLQVTEISQYTDFPEIMNGRLKTLHTKIYAGILARPQIDNNIMQEYSIKPINMVIANFYPYVRNIPKKNNMNINNNLKINNIDDNIIESIDIGGPSIVRAAAKNYKNVVVIIDNNDYINIINELNNNHGQISINTRLKLAVKAFEYVATYETIIANNFKKQFQKNTYCYENKNHNNKNKNINIYLPHYTTFINMNYVKKENMRYGENPHQSAAFYINTQNQKHDSIAYSKQLQGKKLSYNNILDSDVALECVKTFTNPTCVIVKHGNPCGVATDNTILNAYKKAYQTDPTSSFGGVIAFNHTLDKDTAKTIIEQQFTEIIIAPFIDYDAIKILNNKKNIRILTYVILKTLQKKSILKLESKHVNGGLLIQNQDINITTENNIKIVTQHQPTKKEITDALFCWKIVKFTKSNAIVYGRNEQTIGIGSGQTSRICAAKIATMKAEEEGFDLKNATMASDAFLPFSDTVDIAAKSGITCIIQPGGGIHEKEIIQHAEKNDISMIFTYRRHFRH